MIHKLFFPVILLLITFSAYNTYGQDKNVHELLKDSATRHMIMNQMMNNTEYMNEFMNSVMKDENARNIMMDHMFMMADRDSSFTKMMYNHMKNFDHMMGSMQNMMNRHSMMGQGMMGQNGMMHHNGMMSNNKRINN